ncbi:MAG: STAS domain-containing protein [Nitrospirae bacterium]|nr:STAS domain-containing protein [Nitrospirota bacterium]
MKSTAFNVASKCQGDAAVVYPRGYLNNIAGESLVSECHNVIGQGAKKIVLNFRETDFINSIGVSLLLNIIEDLNNIGGTLCFAEMSKIHRDTFEMLGLTKYILVFNDENEALQYLSTETS